MPTRSSVLVPAAALVLALAGCSSSNGRSSGGPQSAPSTTATTASGPTSTGSTIPTTPPATAYSPATPQPSPDAAAAALISDWASGTRAAAARVAAPAAVAAVFGQPYPYSYIQSRGCTDPGTNPGTCTYANRQSGALYEIGVTRTGGGWYVSSVSVEN